MVALGLAATAKALLVDLAGIEHLRRPGTAVEILRELGRFLDPALGATVDGRRGWEDLELARQPEHLEVVAHGPRKMRTGPPGPVQDLIVSVPRPGCVAAPALRCADLTP